MVGTENSNIISKYIHTAEILHIVSKKHYKLNIYLVLWGQMQFLKTVRRKSQLTQLPSPSFCTCQYWSHESRLRPWQGEQRCRWPSPRGVLAEAAAHLTFISTISNVPTLQDYTYDIYINQVHGL